MGDFGLHIPFYIDDGELDGLSPKEAFALGAEYVSFICQVESQSIYSDEWLTYFIHQENLIRVHLYLKENEYDYEIGGPIPGSCHVEVKVRNRGYEG